MRLLRGGKPAEGPAISDKQKREVVEHAFRVKEAAAAMLWAKGAESMVQYLADMCFLGVLQDAKRAGDIPCVDDAIQTYLNHSEDRQTG